VNERARWRYRHILYSLLALLFIGFLVFQAEQRLTVWARETYGIKSYVLVTQGLDKTVQAEVAEWFDNQLQKGRLRNPDYTELMAEITRLFPLVGGASWARYNPETLTCQLNGVLPLWSINHSFVMGDNGRLYQESFFSERAAQLPHIHVNPSWLEGSRLQAVSVFLHSLSPGVLAAFACTYQNPHMIVLAPKDSLDLPHHCVCIVDDRTVQRLPDIATLMGLCMDAQEGQEGEAGGKVSCFDFRFSGRPIRESITPKECTYLQRI